MKEYLKMSDDFKCSDMPMLVNGIAAIKGVGINKALSIMHAINSHDELVAEVERLRLQLQHAFMAGWEEGVNGMECEEAEIASVEMANQL